MKRLVQVAWVMLSLLTGLSSCNRIKPEAPARIQLDSTLVAPGSELSVPIHYPVQELENLANEKLANKIIEVKIPLLGGKNDSLYLSISRFQPVKISYDGVRGITYSLPVQIDGHMESKVVGITIKNKTPIRAKVIITMFSELYMNRDWNIEPQTQLKSIKWVEEPKVRVAGINFNLKPPIENAIEKNKENFVAKLDATIAETVNVNKMIAKLWGDIQKPIRINKKVVPVWLKGDASNMNGRILSTSKDTLTIEIGLFTQLRTVFDSAASITQIKPLPKFKQKKENSPGLTAFAHTSIPFEILNGVVSQVTDTMEFAFSGHTVRIQSSEIYGTPEGLAIRIALRGDIKADVYLRGTLGFDSVGKQLVINNFGFDVNSEQSLLSAADWFAHDEIIERLRPYLTLPLDKFFDALPALINKGIEKGKLGRKIDVSFSTFDLSIQQHLITTKDIQLIVQVKGRADVELQRGLFDKKKTAKP